MPGTRRYRSLDDIDVLDAARRDPGSLIEGSDPVTLDEVQREPDLLLAIKRIAGGICSQRNRTSRSHGRRSLGAAVSLPAYAVNRTKRLIKSPKLYWSDTGLALAIAGMDQPVGAHLSATCWRRETFAYISHRVRQEGTCGVAAAHGEHARMADR